MLRSEQLERRPVCWRDSLAGVLWLRLAER
jgi:hypothetical protein